MTSFGITQRNVEERFGKRTRNARVWAVDCKSDTVTGSSVGIREARGTRSELEIAREATDAEIGRTLFLAIDAGPSVSRFSCFNYKPRTFCHQDNLFVLSGL